MEVIAGRFRIDGFAGSGGFGDVYKGYDERMDRAVAIKVVSSVGDAEAAILKCLSHPGLPCVYDIINMQNNTYIVMEWIEGINLEDFIEENGQVNEELVVRIGMEILDILSYLHNLKPAIVYQDLKPANVMMKPDGKVMLVDFGTAIIMSYGDDKKRLAGTVGYGSPEQRGLTKSAYADERSDIYSWGAVMYSLLSGQSLSKPPYTMKKIRYVCPQISFGLAHVITKAVKRDASDRYMSVLSVKNALNKSYLTDYMYRFLFLCGVLVAVIPFLFAWYFGYKQGVYELVEKIYERNIAIKDIVRFTTEIGAIFIAIGWMFGILRKLHIRKYMKVKRSVFLSERKYPGLWIGATLIGIVCGYMWGENMPASISYAAEKGEIKDILPISVLDSNGNQKLVRYDAVYDFDGDFKMCIDKDRFTENELVDITITMTNCETGEIESRSLLVNSLSK